MMSNIPNAELWAEFVQAVRDGKISGLTLYVDGSPDGTDSETSIWLDEWIIWSDKLGTVQDLIVQDHLCAFLRRWMRSKGYGITLNTDSGIVIGRLDNPAYLVGERDYPTETDWHMKAALQALEWEAKRA